MNNKREIGTMIGVLEKMGEDIRRIVADETTRRKNPMLYFPISSAIANVIAILCETRDRVKDDGHIAELPLSDDDLEKGNYQLVEGEFYNWARAEFEKEP